MNVKALLSCLAACLVGLVALLTLGAAPSAAAKGFIVDGSFEDGHTLAVTLAAPIEKGPDKVTVFERTSPDIPMTVTSVTPKDDGRVLEIGVEEAVGSGQAYYVQLDGVVADGRTVDSARFLVRMGFFGILATIILSAALIQNFVFTRYLGLCIFFGTSARRETAVGMGISFTLVMMLSAVFIWAAYTFVLKPFHLDFLQVLVFVGIVAIFVQFLDTVLRKVNPFLFKKLGVYLVLITTNCIVLAVPLILVGNAYNAWESLALAFGSGAGFLLALFLMASVRERLELAEIPGVFTGLPIAFIVAGLFALAFLGFSGLSL